MDRPHGSLGTTEIHELIMANRRRARIYQDAALPIEAAKITALVDQYLDELGYRTETLATHVPG